MIDSNRIAHKGVVVEEMIWYYSENWLELFDFLSGEGVYPINQYLWKETFKPNCPGRDHGKRYHFLYWIGLWAHQARSEGDGETDHQAEEQFCWKLRNCWPAGSRGKRWTYFSMYW